MLGPHTVSVLTPGSMAADYGTGTQDDWDTATAVTVPGCSVQPVVIPEFDVDRQSIGTRWIAWMPAGTPVTGRSRIVWRGDTYDVDGSPQVWDFDPASHIVVNLRRSEG
jgi:hypothetical protein